MAQSNGVAHKTQICFELGRGQAAIFVHSYQGEGYDESWERYRLSGKAGDPICTWEPEDNITDPMLIEDYWRRRGARRPRPAEDDEDEDDEADRDDDDEVEEPMTQSTVHAATGRPAKRKAKFPSQRPSGAPRRRGKKPCKRKAADRAALEVPPASLDMSERVAQCKERLLKRAGAEEMETAQVHVDGMTYVE